MPLEFEEEKMSAYRHEINNTNNSKIFDFFIKIGIAKTEEQAKAAALVVAILLTLLALWISFGSSLVASFQRSNTATSREEAITNQIENIQNDTSLTETEQEARIRFQQRAMDQLN